MTDPEQTTLDIPAVHRALGIPDDYAANCGLALVPDCATLVAADTDVFGRQSYMDPDACRAWQTMQQRAGEDGVTLQIVSAFRSAGYQKQLLEKKLAAGQRIEQILKVNAAPGYSEHHSGCALDITTPGVTPLEEEFDTSTAFHWLCEHAEEFGFILSFPRGNAAGIAYEPWHWMYVKARV